MLTLFPRYSKPLSVQPGHYIDKDIAYLFTSEGGFYHQLEVRLEYATRSKKKEKENNNNNNNNNDKAQQEKIT